MERNTKPVRLAISFEDDEMAAGNTTTGITAGELPRLVSSNKVEGTTVFSRDGDKIGTVTAFLIDRFEGQVEYVVVAMGGLLGMGSSYHPVPWILIAFDSSREGYVISVEKGVLSSGPSFKSGVEQLFDTAYTDRILSYHGLNMPREARRSA